MVMLRKYSREQNNDLDGIVYDVETFDRGKGKGRATGTFRRPLMCGPQKITVASWCALNFGVRLINWVSFRVPNMS